MGAFYADEDRNIGFKSIYENIWKRSSWPVMFCIRVPTSCLTPVPPCTSISTSCITSVHPNICTSIPNYPCPTYSLCQCTHVHHNTCTSIPNYPLPTSCISHVSAYPLHTTCITSVPAYPLHSLCNLDNTCTSEPTHHCTTVIAALGWIRCIKVGAWNDVAGAKCYKMFDPDTVTLEFRVWVMAVSAEDGFTNALVLLIIKLIFMLFYPVLIVSSLI